MAHNCSLDRAELEPFPHNLIARSLNLEIFFILLDIGLAREYHLKVAPSAILLTELNNYKLLFYIELWCRCKLFHTSNFTLYVVWLRLSHGILSLGPCNILFFGRILRKIQTIKISTNLATSSSFASFWCTKIIFLLIRLRAEVWA